MTTLLDFKARVVAGTERVSRELYPAEHRKHLGASLAGHDCTRYLWNTFRWLLLEQHDGRMRRLFERGQREEQQLITILRGMGFVVHDRDAQGNQIRITHTSGHIGGSLDGIGIPPPDWNFPPCVLEFKTHNAKSFTDLEAKNVLAAKPMHFVQMSIYGKSQGLEYGLYGAVGKNDDAIHWEPVKLDFGAADNFMKRMEYVVSLQTPPKKISETATDWRCKRCHFNGICHSGEAPEKNCRSCEHASPIQGGMWYCDFYKDAIPETVIATGCETQWRRLV